MSETPLQILIVEDNPSDVRLLQESLAGTGAEGSSFFLATRLSEAPPLLASHPPSVILLDLSLPDSHGLETLRRMQSFAREVPIIVMTGPNDEELGTQALHAGAQDYVVKGRISSRALPRILYYAMERHRLRAALQAETITDSLTGVSNRRGFLYLARHHIELARRKGGSLVLFHVELDGLQQINDSLGHEAGDCAIREVAAVLRTSFRNTDLLARLGDGEFAALAIDAGSHASALVQQRVAKETRLRNLRHGRYYLLSLILGAYEWPPNEKLSLEALMARGYAAMLERKRGAGRVSVLLPNLIEVGRSA